MVSVLGIVIMVAVMGSCGCFYELEVLFAGVPLIRALMLGSIIETMTVANC